MKGFSRVFLLGYLGLEPELQTSKGGAKFTRLNISTHRSRKTEDGKWNTSTEWHRVMVWGPKAELCSKKLGKGSAIAIEGFLDSYKVEREDGPSHQVSIVAEQIHFLPNPKQKSFKFAESEQIEAPAPEFPSISA